MNKSHTQRPKDWKRNLEPAQAARRGQRINSPGKDWPQILSALRRRLRQPIRGKVSVRQCSYAVGVDGKTIARWLSGRHLPTFNRATKVRKWLSEVKAGTARTRTKPSRVSQ